MDLYLLITPFIIIILSFVFKILDDNKYDTQLVFIALSFLYIIIYRTINVVHCTKNKKHTLSKIKEMFNSNIITNYAMDTLNKDERIRLLENELDFYKKNYGTNDIINDSLDLKIDNLESSINKLNDIYGSDIINNEPEGEGNQIIINGSQPDSSELNNERLLEAKQLNINTDAVRNLLIDTLKRINNDIVIPLSERENTV
jgi:hypothetical protein